jgi:hypothetical protein
MLVVKLTVWQFLAIVLALVGAYLVYSMWWTKQDGNAWVRNFNHGVSGQGDTVKTTKEGETVDGAPVEKAPSPW